MYSGLLFAEFRVRVYDISYKGLYGEKLEIAIADSFSSWVPLLCLLYYTNRLPRKQGYLRIIEGNLGRVVQGE